uniref:Uncharacterized protein n=1 Tax=Rhizophora mucronata TaxID=61149 RepID=A0A2P2PHF0_RHIMU
MHFSHCFDSFFLLLIFFSSSPYFLPRNC